MQIDWVTLFCGKHRRNDKLRFNLDVGSNPPVCSITTDNASHTKITFFLDSETDLINFKNSVVNAVNNWKGKR